MIHKFNGVPSPEQLSKLLDQAIEDMMEIGIGAIGINLGTEDPQEDSCGDPRCTCTGPCPANTTPVDEKKMGKLSDAPVVKEETLTFDHAIKALEDGAMVRREAWGEVGYFVFRQLPAEIPLETIPNMQSLPASVKQELVNRGMPINYDNQYALVHPDNLIESWTPNVEDIRASDWIIQF